MRELNMESIRSVDRAIDILNAFSLEKPKLTTEHIMKAANLPRATVYRLLYTMERRGLIRYDEESLEYRLGFKFLEYGSQVTSTLDVVNEADEILTSLHEMTNHTVLMSLIEENQMLYVFKKEKQTGLKFSSSVGERRSLLYGALGRVGMAFLSNELIDQLLKDEIPSWTPYTVTDKNLIREQLEQIRKSFIYLEKNQTNLGVTALASPVFDAKGNILAVVGILCPSAQINDEDLEATKEMLLKSTQFISQKLGYKVVAS